MKKILIGILVSFMFVVGSQAHSFAQDDSTSTVPNTTVSGEYVPSSQDGFVRFIPIGGTVQIIAQEDNIILVDVSCVDILPTSSRTYHRVFLSDGRMQLVNTEELIDLCAWLELVDASSTTAT